MIKRLLEEIFSKQVNVLISCIFKNNIIHELITSKNVTVKRFWCKIIQFRQRWDKLPNLSDGEAQFGGNN